ncbi:MAG TPA: BamA/TamA family outer membrane protein, partial [Thermoanaerobaculia bacterium]
YEYRNTLGNSVEKPIKRAFEMTPEEFDTRFRTWLRKQYLPALISKGEPTEYGEPFRVDPDLRSQEISPAQAPSGDLMVALTTYKEDVDVALFNVPERKMIRNLSRGYEDSYEYIIAQFLTTGPVMGRDIAFSPSGDHVAMFVKKERGRSLLIVNALSGAFEKLVEMNDVEQQLNPAYSPDGSKIAFHAFQGNRADIFVYDLAQETILNLTHDEFFDSAPVFSPDGRWLVYSSVVNGYAKLFRLDLANPSQRYQLTRGEWNDIDAAFSPDGKRIFYASDRLTGREMVDAAKSLEQAENEARTEGTPPVNPSNYAAYNIYSLNLDTGDVLQYTDVVGGCFTPGVFIGTGNKERLIFSSYYKGRWQLYTTPSDNPLRTAETVTLPTEPLLAGDRTGFVPPVEVAIDEEKVEDYGGFKLFIENVEVNGGVNSDQTFISRSVIYMSDMLGNRRFIASLDSVSTFSNFDFLYFDLRNRLNWGVRLFDNRTYFLTPDFEEGRFNRRRLDRQTGLVGILSYPFDRYHRFDFGGGFIVRDTDYPFQDASGRVYLPRQDEYPILSGTFSGDSSVWKQFGPIAGRRYQISANYASDLDEGGTLTADLALDARQYYQLSSRSLLAARVYGAMSEGNFPSLHYFGGLNTLRGYDFRTFVGDRAMFANFEFRFPLIDVLATPFLQLRNIRGSLFLDVGGAFFGDENFDAFEDNRLKDALVCGDIVGNRRVVCQAGASVGYGITVNLFGLELHWDFARRTDLQEIDGQFRTSFWIGETF